KDPGTEMASLKMAEARFPQNEFTKDPVTIQCGHSYCMSCITGCWNEEDEKGVYSCPQCTQNFSTRPALFKNVVFGEMLEKMKKTKLQSVSAGAGDVQYDVCTGKNTKPSVTI
uniref:RING-type domain-containing protein n=1 Tax=Cyprinus carpio TaxID=7962 RepID=A0A8C1NE33_CYPCA